MPARNADQTQIVGLVGRRVIGRVEDRDVGRIGVAEVLVQLRLGGAETARQPGEIPGVERLRAKAQQMVVEEGAAQRLDRRGARFAGRVEADDLGAERLAQRADIHGFRIIASFCR